LQFKGALRSPGDRGPGIPVVLVVDEFHLEIIRGSELVGRWYLADVEVVRDIAEKFVLFLGEEEMEFLAEDALQFAYDGVTAMQNAWLRAQKKKRRHRRAAADAARRKDESPAMDEEALSEEPARRPAAKSELARRLAAAAANDEVREAPEVKRRATSPVSSLSTERPTLSARRKKVAEEVAVTREVSEPAPAKSMKPRRRQEPPAPPEPSMPPWIAPEPEAEETPWRTSRTRPEEPAPEPTSIRIPVEPAAPIPAPPAIRPRRQRIVEPPLPVEEPPPVPTRRGRRLLPAANGDPLAPSADAPLEVAAKTDAEVRFAPEGHHPAETSTGLLSKLRKQPKLPDDHVHKFVETGSSVGLVRRVCTECSYVSIGNDDEGSAVTRW
jgi:hypothetical protein